MAPLIGQEMTERLFLQRFALLCADPLFHVRKVCAANFGDFSGVVGSQPTEQTLVSENARIDDRIKFPKPQILQFSSSTDWAAAHFTLNFELTNKGEQNSP